MVVLVGIVIALLLAANLALVVALVRLRRGRARADDDVEVFEAPRPAGVGGARRLITVEILNPLEVAAQRAGRVAGLAGALAPGLTRRVVYDQTVKTLRRELPGKGVHADVRLHTVRAVAARGPARPSVVEARVIDEVAPLDLSEPR